MGKRGLTNRLLEERPIRVAYSTYRRWESCGMSEALMRLGVHRDVVPKRDYLAGNVLHSALEDFVRTRERPSATAFEETFDSLASKDGVFWRSGADHDSLLRKAAFRFGKLSQFTLGLLEGAAEAEVEFEFERSFPTQLPSNEPYVMTTKCDLFIRYESGESLVYDYKSSSPRSAEDLQLRWAAAVLDHGGSSPLHAGFAWVTDSGEVRQRLVPRSPELEADAVERARVFAESLLTGNVTANPDPRKCGRCRTRTACKHSAFTTTTGRSSG